MNDMRELGVRNVLLVPSIVGHLASSTAIYKAVVQDVHDLIDSAISEHPELGETYGELMDNLEIALEPSEMGSLTLIETSCHGLMGDAQLGRQSDLNQP